MTGLEMKYFVLKPRGNDIYALASRKAMMVYSQAILKENHQLAIDLAGWVEKEALRANKLDTIPTI